MSNGLREMEVIDLRISAERRLRVRAWDGVGRPLVLLHGLLDDSEGWLEVAHATARPCYAIDLPGFGRSDLPLRPRISSYAEAICEGLEQLGVDACTLVGHSLGGAVAASVAERCDAVDALALLAPAGFGHIRLAEAISLPGIRHAAQAALPLGLINPLTITAGYATFVAHNRLPSRDLIRRTQRRAFNSGPGVGVAVQALAAASRSHRGFLHRPIGFTGPVAVLWGEHDALVNPHHRFGLQRALPQAHIEVWEGMGHHPQRERPDQLATFIETHAANERLRHAQRARTAPLQVIDGGKSDAVVRKAA